MENILEDLYCGNVHPADQGWPRREEHRRLQKLCSESCDRLFSRLNEEQKELFMQFEEYANSRSSLEDCQAFVQGFSLAVRLLVEALAAP